MNSAMGALIQQILPQQTASVEMLLRQLAQPMTPSLDALINQLIPLNVTSSGNKTGSSNAAGLNNTGVNSAVISSTGANSATINSGVIEAIVLSSSKLLDSGDPAKFKITVNGDKQSFELTTKAPIPAGTRILLNIVQQNLATIVAINDNARLPTNAAGGVTALINTTGSSKNTTAAQSQPASLQSLSQSIIDQALRTALPQQQPLKLLLPLLQQISQQPPQHWPKALTNNLKVLLGQFPSSDQAQQPQRLKQSMQNSGVFFEAKLAKLLAQKNVAAQQPTSKPANNNDSQIKGDIKGLMQRLIAQIAKVDTAIAQPSSHLTASVATDTHTPAPLLYSALQHLKPSGLDLLINNNHTGNTNKEQAADVLLRQLSQQLLASLARSQVNQLESLAVRQSNSSDNQAPVNSWALEIPILHGKHTDNLELRIDQYELENAETKGPAASKKIWTVMLAFDLHSSGKMNVELKILDQTVSATVWSEQEQTYQLVRQQVDQLKNNLKKVGVQVKQVECQLGLPPKSTTPIYQQLVDIRT